MSELISRQLLIDAIENTDWYHINENTGKMVHGSSSKDESWYKADDIYKAIENVPSTEPERKKGKWIDVKINSYTSRTCCSECGSSAPFIYKSDDYYSNHAHGETTRTKFCPYCGADMRGEDK